MKFMDKAKNAATQAMHRAGEVAGDLAEKAGPLTDKASGMAAKGVDKAAGGLNRATGGRFEEKIDKVSSKVGGVLNREDRPKTDKDDKGGEKGTSAS